MSTFRAGAKDRFRPLAVVEPPPVMYAPWRRRYDLTDDPALRRPGLQAGCVCGGEMIEGACHCGQVHWRYGPEPKGATACNCTVCRRWGALWIYGFHGKDLRVDGPTTPYVRGEAIEFLFCSRCACVVAWRAINAGADGRRWGAVNVRLAEPEAVAALPIDHFDGLNGLRRLPRDGKCVADYWF